MCACECVRARCIGATSPAQSSMVFWHKWCQVELLLGCIRFLALGFRYSSVLGTRLLAIGFRLICSPHRFDSSPTSARSQLRVRACVCVCWLNCLFGCLFGCWPNDGLLLICGRRSLALTISLSSSAHTHSLLSREPTAICFVFVLLLLLLLHFLVYVLYSNVGYSAKCWRARERVWESATNRKREREHICSKEGLLQRECAMLCCALLCCFWYFCTCAFDAASFCYCCAAISAASMYFFTSVLCAQW